MARVHITEKIWYDPEVKNYVMLDVTDDIEHPVATIIKPPTVLLPKDEYHCTLVAAGKLSANHDQVREVIEDIKAYLLEHPNMVTFEGIGTDYYYCCKDDESTLIVSALVTGLDGLRDVVRRTFPEYSESSPHITLLKSENSPYGIGINSPTDLNQYCERITIATGL